jgi:Uma2 family endonuclease
MAVEQVEQIQQAPARRWRFTVDDYYRMGEVGILPHDARVELVNGDVIEMPPIGSHHNGSVIGLDEYFRDRLGRRVSISVQGPLILRQYGTPQPDVLILRRRNDHYRSANPTADDVLLLLEVSDSTLPHDRDTKGPMYAAAGIQEYWIVNLVDSLLVVYRQPVDGVYRSVTMLGKDDSIQPLAFPDVTIAVSEILA